MRAAARGARGALAAVAHVLTTAESAAPSVAHVLTTAESACCRAAAWFDLESLSDIDVQEDAAGILASTAYVEELVAAEVAAGVPRSRIVVAGFSQGGAIALTAGLRAHEPLAGIVALSSWLPIASDYPASLGAGAAGAQVFMAHGTQDRVVRTAYGVRSQEALTKLGCRVDFQMYRMAHSAVPEELAAAAQWLAARLP